MIDKVYFSNNHSISNLKNLLHHERLMKVKYSAVVKTDNVVESSLFLDSGFIWNEFSTATVVYILYVCKTASFVNLCQINFS